MKIGFFRGRVSLLDGKEQRVWWAQVAEEFWVLVEGSDEVIHGFEPPTPTSVERITVLELPEIDEEGMQTIIVNVLKGGYLDKPGVKDSGEAVLFVLVNEAIQALSEIGKDEASS